MNNFYEKLNLDKTKPLVVAFSGGVDSAVLVDLLLKSSFNIILAHINHHKRIESDYEEEQIRLFGKERGIIVEVNHYYHQKNNFQAKAREYRYKFFYDVVKKYNAQAILTAHHSDDRLESIIINILRGSNLYGYSGIGAIVPYLDTYIYRPLLQYSKQEIMEYAHNNNIRFFEDASNHEDIYLRNRIRSQILPSLYAECPSLNNKISLYSQQISQAFSYIREQSKNYLKEQDNKIDIPSYLDLHEAIQMDILNYLFEINDIDSSFQKLTSISDLIKGVKPNSIYSIGKELFFIRNYNVCYVNKIIGQNKLDLKLKEDEILDVLGYGRFYLTKNLPQKYTSFLKICYNIKNYPLRVRHRTDGDILEIKNGHQKLKDFFINRKIPKQVRDKSLIVTTNSNQILWVLDLYKKECPDDDFIYLIYDQYD